MVVVKLGSKDINLDQELLKFDEHTINKFLQTFAANYNIYYQYHSDAQFVHSRFEDKYDAVYSDKFRLYREESSSDKMADMKAKSDKEVQEAIENVRIAKHNVNLIWGYLRAMDHCYNSALNFCYNLRKEMDTIFKDAVKSSKLPYEL
jgi:hypothetical protein